MFPKTFFNISTATKATPEHNWSYAHQLSLAVALCILCIWQNPKWKNPVGLGQVTRRPLEKSIVSWSSPAHPPICQLLIEVSSISYMMLNICEIDIFVWRNSVLIKLHQFWWHCTHFFSLTFQCRENVSAIDFLEFWFLYSKGISRGLVTNFLYRLFISFLVSLDHILKIEGGSTLRFDGESIFFWGQKVRFSLYTKKSKLSDHVDLWLIL